jgi:hypothetical protein
MITRPAGLGMGVGRVSRRLRGVGVLAMLDAGLHTMQHVESVCKVPQGAGVLRLLVRSGAVGVCIDSRSVAQRVEAMC